MLIVLNVTSLINSFTRKEDGSIK